MTAGCPSGPGPGRDDGAPRIERLLDMIEATPGDESTTILLARRGLVIERIVSLDYASPPGFWYEQECREWVVVLAGRGVVEFADGRSVPMGAGDALDIPAGCRHRVAWTDPRDPTVWIAVRMAQD